MPNWRIPAPFWLFLILIVLGLLFQAVPLYTHWLWFQEVGYAQVFLTILKLRGLLFVAVGLAVFLFLYLNLSVAARTAPPDVLWELEDQLGLPSRAEVEPLIRRLLVPVLGVIAFFFGVRASGAWETLLAYFNRGPFAVTDPIFNRDLAFYVFSLPFWRLLYGWALFLVAFTLILSLLLYVLQRGVVVTTQGLRLAARARAHALLLGAGILALWGVGFWLNRYELLYSPRGVVYGASYTDVNASLPVLMILTVLAGLAAAACLYQLIRPGFRALLAGLLVLGVVWVGGLGLYPSAVQRLRVAPNELVMEGPYIAHNIRMTRQAYGLNRIEDKDFPAEETLDAEVLSRNQLTVKNIRLWDHRPLLTTYGQLQEIRTYYKFLDVDNDRYLIDGEKRQLMLSPRELSYEHLPSRIWINEHLIFTHGYGIVVGPVNRISSQGLPEFFVKDIPPGSTSFPAITRPEIYYGERSNEYVFVQTRAQELDYPSGDQNVYTRYEGQGGISIGSFLRKLVFAARFGEIKILLSDDLTSESRIMIYRNIGERVRRIAPFLRFDRDPYLVVTDDGRMVWLIDAYTVTDRYPYSEPVPDVGNYIRNSVKAAVDAYNGAVTFYVADPEDPLIQVYRRAFHGLFHPLDEMPADLRAHIRYPVDLFATQARMYATYHMEDPQVFYNKEDLWAIPQRDVDGRNRPMEPYYTILRLPGESKEEFILLTLFNPSRRDNMIAWLAGRSDGANYGRLIAYMFPKQKLVYGPRQIDARIDQNPVFSQQLSLWNQLGSVTIRGSLLAIPIEQSLIYVQPLYLAASDQGALPELRRVFVAFGDEIAMEPTIEQSLDQIFGDGRPVPAVIARPPKPGAPAPAAPGGLSGVAERAWQIWNRAQEALRRGDWAAYGTEVRRLEDTLRQLKELTTR
ncbi:MAG: UPF0182 family protein [Candidatus Methylomirabilia bacterium]